MTTAEIQTKLTRLQRYGTRYELVLTNGNETMLLQYTSKKSMRGLVKSCQSRIEALRHFMGPDFILMRVPKLMEAQGGGWTIRFSGRTQREAITHGELPFAQVPGRHAWMPAEGKAGALTCATCGLFPSHVNHTSL